MSDPTCATPTLRWARAAVVAAVATTVGVTAHVSAGGLLPGAPVMASLVCSLVVCSAAALGHPGSYPRLAALVVGGQAGVHLVLTAVSGHGGAHPAPASLPPGSTPLSNPLRQGGVHDDLAVVAYPTPSATGGGTPHWLAHLQDDLTGPHLLMAVAHLAAAAGVAAWLFAGERALWTLIGLLGARLEQSWRVLLIPPLVARPRGAATVAGSHGPRASRKRLSAANGAAGRRGPPLSLAALRLMPAV
ncbi:MAG: hypothetical protein ACXWDL_01930 [Nocardioides sp.]